MPRTPNPDGQAPKRTAIAASATVYRNVTGTKVKSGNALLPKEASGWQDECWMYRDSVGELRYAVSWFSNAFSRGVMRVGRKKADGTIETIPTGSAVDALEAILGTNQSQMLKAMGEHYFIAGEWYIIGVGLNTDDEDWGVYSPSEVSKNGKTYSINTGGGDRLIIGENDPAAVIRVHNPHPRNKTMSDSPVRAVLANLREIEGLSAHIATQIRSRLAGGGVLWMPTEATFVAPNTDNEGNDADGSNDPFMEALGGAMMASIADPSNPAALVPIIVRVPADAIEHIKHMTFWTELDEKVTDMRDRAIRRFALGVDLPPEVLLGTADVNHWGSWQIEESSIKTHIEPAFEVVAAALTTVLRDAEEDDNLIVLYDTSAIRLRPNRSKEAMELYDRGEIGEKALLRETGFADEDKMDDDERQRWLLRKIASGSATPAQVEAALRMLGVEIVTEGGTPTEGQETRESRPDPSLRDHPTHEIPEEQSQAAALQATCDALVLRALERVGNRLANQTRAKPPGVETCDLYLSVQPKSGSEDGLLEGAWTMLPRLLGGTDFDSDLIRESLDAYTRGLITQGHPHSPEKMMQVVTAGIRAKAA